MKIIEPYFEFVDEPDALKKIELCGRVCYKSESKITDDSAETFVKNLIRRGHESVLEHAVFIVKCDDVDAAIFDRICSTIECRYGGRVLLKSTRIYRNVISGNVRAWRDFMRDCSLLGTYPKFLNLFRGTLFNDVNPWQQGRKTAQFINKSDLYAGEIDAHFTETVKFVVDRGISHEIVRHRTASFSQESTRYCNYRGDGVTFIKPPFFDETDFEYWQKAVEFADYFYSLLITRGATPQQARSVLPNSTKTELIMTANIECWKHFFELRTGAGAHPQMKQIAEPMKAAFIKRGILHE